MSNPGPLGPRHNPNTPEGQIESIGMFARAIGARRIKIAVLVVVLAVIVIMVLGAIA